MIEEASEYFGEGWYDICLKVLALIFGTDHVSNFKCSYYFNSKLS